MFGFFASNIRIDVGFRPSPLQARLIEQTKQDIRERLRGHGIARLVITLKQRPGAQLALQFAGDPEAVDRAKQRLGIY